MELKEATVQLLNLLHVEDVISLPKALMDMVSENNMSFWAQYINLFGKDCDVLQGIYQFWMSDRGKNSKNQDFTPKSLAKLVTATVLPRSGVVYDCCSGTGALTIAMHQQNRSLKFVCEELDYNIIPFLLANLIVHNITAVVIHGDVLRNEIYEIYSVKAMEKYSIVHPMDGYRLTQYDAVISNPPYNIPWIQMSYDGFEGKPLPPAGNANYAFVLHCLHHLKNGAGAALILPNGALSSEPEKGVRQYLVENGLLFGVLKIPAHMFESTGIPTTVLVLRGGSNGVEMIDTSELCHEELREQRGEAHNTQRVYKKTLNAFGDDDIGHIINLLQSHAQENGVSGFASAEDIQKNEYNLSPTRYIESTARATNHRSYQDISKDLREVAIEKLRVKVTINKVWAEQLGWKEVAELCEKSEKETKKINEGAFKLLGLPPLPAGSFVKLSNSKEFKIENVSKDAISSIFMIFMPMLRQHIYYLNERENILLAELRDALLPDLMSGKIDVSNEFGGI